MFKKGDIIIGEGYGKDHTKAFHPIIYLKGNTNEDFIGLMLTTSSKWENNFALYKEHFKVTDDNGIPFKIIFNNSYCVHLMLNKRAEWSPYAKVGQLTDEGMKYVESKINNSNAIYWDEYIATIRLRRK